MTLLKKLLEVKSEIGTLVKKSNNPFFKSKYLDLNDLLSAVEPLLEKRGLLLMQPIHEGQVKSVIYDTEQKPDGSYDRIESGIPLPQLTDPQKLGSAVTYFRRYTLQSLLSLQAEDDDGNKASTPSTKPKLDEVKWTKAINAVISGQYTAEYIRSKYDLTDEQNRELIDVENR